MSTESAYVANVKSKLGTIVTVRGDDWTSFSQNVNDAVAGEIGNVVGALEEAFLGQTNESIAQALSALNPTPVPFAPVPPPVAGYAPAPACAHGPMVRRTAKLGPRTGKDFWACTAPMGSPEKCKTVNI